MEAVFSSSTVLNGSGGGWARVPSVASATTASISGVSHCSSSCRLGSGTTARPPPPSAALAASAASEQSSGQSSSQSIERQSDSDRIPAFSVTLGEVVRLLPLVSTPENLNSELAVEGLSNDSREVASNFVYFCIEGTVQDGHDFAAQAAEKGAVAIVASNNVKNT